VDRLLTLTPMDLKTFLEKVASHPEAITFDETIQVIESHYAFTPTAFQNGAVKNEAGQNSGSCKLFAFAQLQSLTAEQTLHCFGTYYRVDVLNDPEGTSHQNIRNFMIHGWEGIAFEALALARI
jgi:hypothetical protein